MYWTQRPMTVSHRLIYLAIPTRKSTATVHTLVRRHRSGNLLPWSVRWRTWRVCTEKSYVWWAWMAESTAWRAPDEAYHLRVASVEVVALAWDTIHIDIDQKSISEYNPTSISHQNSERIRYYIIKLLERHSFARFFRIFLIFWLLNSIDGCKSRYCHRNERDRWLLYPHSHDHAVTFYDPVTTTINTKIYFLIFDRKVWSESSMLSKNILRITSIVICVVIYIADSIL